MNVDAILISDYATTDSGKLTVVGTFNQFTPQTYPARLPMLCVTVVVHAHHSEAGTDHHARIVLLNERREDVAVQECPFQLSAGPGVPGIPLRHITIWRILTPEFHGPGAFAFEVYIDGTYHAGAAFSALPPTGG